jgi:hypothetical protein
LGVIIFKDTDGLYGLGAYMIGIDSLDGARDGWYLLIPVCFIPEFGVQPKWVKSEI